jgi:Family of unknown function (DUF6491)
MNQSAARSPAARGGGPARVAPLAAALTLAACATGPETSWAERLQAKGLMLGDTVTSIPRFRLDGFDALDAEHVILYTGVNRRHLVTFGAPCHGLNFAQRLAYRAPAVGSIGRLDTLTPLGQGAGTVPCVIDSIQELKAVAAG